MKNYNFQLTKDEIDIISNSLFVRRSLAIERLNKCVADNMYNSVGILEEMIENIDEIRYKLKVD